MFILPGQLPSARSSGGGSEESPSRQFPARLGRQAADTAYSAAGASSGNRPQTQRRNSSSYTFAGNQPLVSLPEINLLSLYRKSTSCNFAAFCKRCRSPISLNPIPRPSVAFEPQTEIQPLAILPLFARGAAPKFH